MTACSISWSITIVRDRRWVVRVAALLGVIASVAALQTIREQGGVLTGAGLWPALRWPGSSRVPACWSPSRWRCRSWLAHRSALLPHRSVLMGLSRPRRDALGSRRDDGLGVHAARSAVLQRLRCHRRHAVPRRRAVRRRRRRAVRDGAAAVGSAVAAALAYLPEQVIWYFLVALFPIGLVFSLRRDVVLTGLFAVSHWWQRRRSRFSAGTSARWCVCACSAIPYLASLSMVGLCELLARAARAGRPPSEKAELTWP